MNVVACICLFVKLDAWMSDLLKGSNVIIICVQIVLYFYRIWMLLQFSVLVIGIAILSLELCDIIVCEIIPSVFLKLYKVHTACNLIKK